MANEKTPEQRKAEARARRIQAEENRTRAVAMRKMGMSYADIADQLDMAVSSVHKTVAKAMAKVKARQEEDAEIVKTMELERLDRMLLAAWPGAIKGNHLLIDRVLKTMERRAKLLGLDAPQKVAPTDPSGENPYDPNMTPDEREARIRELLALESQDDGSLP